VEELASDKTLQHHCASGICVVAIVSPEEKDDLKVVHELHDQNTNGLFRFGWMTSDKASAIVKQLDLVQDYPGLFILHASKQLYRPYVGAWDQKSIARWLDQIASGRVQAFAFSGDLKISSEEQHQEKAARDEL
jgi:protein disulfide-isomerase A6